MVGAGRAGTTLAQAWQHAGLADTGVVLNRSTDSAAKAVGQIGAGQAVSSWPVALFAASPADSEDPSADWIMLAVPDGELPDVAAMLARALQAGDQPALVFHISGQLDNSVLAPLAEQGILTASAHPVLAFAQPDTARQQLPHSHCLLVAEDQAYQWLEYLFAGLGMDCIRAPENLNKAQYHAAMVCASNFTCALQYLAENLAGQAGLSIGSARQLLTNLCQHSLTSVARHGPLMALTGPIERGDLIATERLLQAWQVLPDSQSDTLIALAATVADMGQAKSSLDASQRTALQKLFNQFMSSGEL